MGTGWGPNFCLSLSVLGYGPNFRWFLPVLTGVHHKEIMYYNCAANGCKARAAGYSRHCTSHRKALTRHGDPLQGAITVFQLKPYLARVVARQKANKDNEAWSILEGRWEALVAHAKEITDQWEGGMALHRPTVDAAGQIQVLARDAPPGAVVRTVMAMYLMLEEEGRRFRSDRAFDYQLVRRVRGLAEMSKGTYWDHSTGKKKRVYRDLPRRVVEVLAGWLKESFGGPGLQLARLEQAKGQALVNERSRLTTALTQMK